MSRCASDLCVAADVPVLQPGFLEQFAVKARHRTGVETDDMRQQDADRQAVRDAVVRSKRIGTRVANAEHRILDRGAGEERAHLHGAARFQVGRRAQHLFEVDLQQLPRLAREHLRHRIAPRRHIRFDGVRQGVDAGEGGDLRRLRDGDFRIEDRCREGGFAVAAGHFQVRLLVGDQGERLGLAAGARRRRHADRRQHRLLGPAEALVVGHRAAVGEDEIDPLGAVHGAAAADGNDQVDAERPSEIDADADVLAGRILLDLIKDEHLEPGFLQRFQSPPRMPDGVQTRIGHEQRSRGTELPRQFAQALKRSGTEHDARRRVKIERLQRPAGSREQPGGRQDGRGRWHGT